VTFELTAP